MMKNKLVKHLIIRLSISIFLLLLLHFSQVEYAINANLEAIGLQDNPALFIGSIVLFVWLVYLGVETAKLFKNKAKWFALSNILLILLNLIAYAFINILIAVTQC